MDTATLCATILAWGGMKVRHGQSLFKRLDRWRDGAIEVRTGHLSRSEAYGIFAELRAKGSLPGMGPAFFTKLIFFLRGANVSDPGYIMDQWTACSVNVLTGNPNTVLTNATFNWRKPKKGPVELKSDFQVSEHNSAEDYERFCRMVEQVARDTGLQPHDAEILMMSEGKGKGAWRNYVYRHRRAASPATLPHSV